MVKSLNSKNEDGEALNFETCCNMIINSDGLTRGTHTGKENQSYLWRRRLLEKHREHKKNNVEPASQQLAHFPVAFY